MNTLKGKEVYLRALEPEDLPFLFDSENNENLWSVSHTNSPFSRFVLAKYLDNAHLDVYEAKQLRLVIADPKNDQPIGMIDLYDFDPANRRAGIGLFLIKQARGKGMANEALQLLTAYAFRHLNLHQVYAHIGTENTKSIALFEKNNFELVGTRKDWLLSNQEFKDEAIYQLIYKPPLD